MKSYLIRGQPVGIYNILNHFGDLFCLETVT